VIQEDVVMQTGFSTYEPTSCQWQKLFPYQEMLSYVEQARIVITHGGPSSFIMPLQIGKIPIVVPRKKTFDEHVNDHQVEFSKAVAERQTNIIVVEKVNQIAETIENYESIVQSMPTAINSNNVVFNEKLSQIVMEMFS
jgi:UDP-N-acetylglucosamine transferase subunit ALG13